MVDIDRKEEQGSKRECKQEENVVVDIEDGGGEGGASSGSGEGCMREGEELKERSLTLTFSNVSYVARIPVPKGPVEDIATRLESGDEEKKREKKTRHMDVTLLNNVSGVINSGTKTLLIGPYKSGKTTLMELLTGRKSLPTTTSSSSAPSGQGLISANGLDINRSSLVAPGAGCKEEYVKHVGYVPQQDVLMPTLTVREALMYAANMRLCLQQHGGGGGVWKTKGHTRQEVEEMVDDIIERMGLTEAADVLTGNQIIRGCSGGQRRRLTIACELICQPKFICLDEPTNGLDSSTAMQTLFYLSELASSSKHNAAVLCTLQQPSYEQFLQFDNVMVMVNRQIVFHGPRADVIEYFNAHLSHILVRALQWIDAESSDDAVGSENEELDRTDSSLRSLSPTSKRKLSALNKAGTLSSDHAQGEQNPADIVLETCEQALLVDDLIAEKRVRNSDGRKGTLNEEHHSVVDEWVANYEKIRLGGDCPSTKEGLHEATDVFGEGKYYTPFSHQLLGCLRRGFLNVRRDPAVLKATIGRSIMVGLLIGTLFRDLDTDQEGARLRPSLFFFYVAMGGMSNLSSVSRLVDNREVYQTQRRQNYFRPSAYFVGQVVVEWPIQAMDALLISLVSYFLVGLSPSVWQFLVFVACYFIIALLGREMCMLMAGLIEVKTLASAAASIVMNILLLSAGFALPTKSFPKPWIWLHYLSIFKYPWEAMCISQITTETFECNPDEKVPPLDYPLLNVPYPVGYGGSQTCPIVTSDDLLNEFDVPTETYYIGVNFAISIVYYIVLLSANYMVARYRIVDPVVNARVQGIQREVALHRAIEAKTSKRSKLNNCDSIHKSKNSVGDVSQSGESEVEVKIERAKSYLFTDMNYDVIVSTDTLISKKQQKDHYDIDTEKGETAPPLASLLDPLVPLNSLDIAHPMSETKKTMLKDSKLSNSKALPKKSVRRLLYGVSGKSEPGCLIALMGPSGAGKTTLLDALAGRIRSPYLYGDIQVNGMPFMSELHARMLGYVEQTNKQVVTDTVRETLQFSADLRLPKSGMKYKTNLVASLLKELRLESVSEAMISSLTDEQRKRVTLGTELAAQTSIIFIDEPTTGLDASSAHAVMKCIRKVADSGRVVICTIHQPTRRVFLQFDKVLLLNRGYTMYFGDIGTKHNDNSHENAAVVEEYFCKLGCKPKEKENPADFILRICQECNDQKLKEFVLFQHKYRKEQLKIEMEEQTENQNDLSNSQPATRATHRMSNVYSYNSSFSTQVSCLLRRAMRLVGRTPESIFSRLIASAFVGFFVGTLFFQMGNSQFDARNRVNFAFFVSILTAMDPIELAPALIDARSVFYRERDSKTYSPLSFYVSLFVAELPFIFGRTVVFCCTAYWIAGLQQDASNFFIFVLTYLLVALMATAFFIICAALSPNVEVAVSTAPILNVVFCVIFSGYLIPQDEIPAYWIWLYYGSYMRYPLEIFVVNELHGLTFGCSSDEWIYVPIASTNNTESKPYCLIDSGDRLIERFDLDYDNIWLNEGVMVIFWVAFMWLGYAALRFKRF
eukprot:Nk52_evm28s1763 gene=Nk52_evmTU28s1763